MSAILPKLRTAVKERLLKNLRRCQDVGLRTRLLIVITLSEGRSADHVAHHQKVHRSTVYRTAARFRTHGEFGLLDRRSGNGPGKLRGGFLDALVRTAADSGEVLLEGRDITGVPPHKICSMGIARSFQRTNIFARLTVFENIQAAFIAHGNGGRFSNAVLGDH